MKRTTSKNVPLASASPSLKRKKSAIGLGDSSLTALAESESPLNFKSPESLLASLLNPVCTIEEFFSEYWEKKPLHVPASTKCNSTELKGSPDELNGYFQKLFNLNICKEILETHQLLYGVDIVMCKYENGFRQNLDKSGPAKFQQIQKHFHGDKMTLQFHQPQRFHGELWKIQEMLECYFGCLVGSNVYMTPENSQGLAPHHDNVEVFILQLEGCKVWKLHKPIVPLAKECSGDLTKGELNGVELISEITMNVGDVLYFPRGTIHQAKVLPGEGFSTHITISAYCNYSWQDYFTSTIPHLVGNSEATVSLRRGLPFNFHSAETRLRYKEDLSRALESLNLAIQKFAEREVCDELACDFFANRLPPRGFKSEPLGMPPSLNGSVRFVHPHHVTISKGKGLHDDDKIEDDEDQDIDSDSEEEFCNDDDDEPNVVLYYSHKNERESHMLGTIKAKPTGLRFDFSCWDSLKNLHHSFNDFIEVKELNLPDLLGLDMLVGLWSEGILETKE